MLDVLQVDVYGFRAHSPEVIVLTVDIHAEGEPFPSPRHVFFGTTEDEALAAFNTHTQYDPHLRSAVEQDAVTHNFKVIMLKESHYPMVRHVFYGEDRETAEAHCEAHANQCRFLKPKIQEGAAQCTWRQLPFKDKGSLEV